MFGEGLARICRDGWESGSDVANLAHVGGFSPQPVSAELVCVQIDAARVANALSFIPVFVLGMF